MTEQNIAMFKCLKKKKFMIWQKKKKQGLKFYIPNAFTANSHFLPNKLRIKFRPYVSVVKLSA